MLWIFNNVSFIKIEIFCFIYKVVLSLSSYLKDTSFEKEKKYFLLFVVETEKKGFYFQPSPDVLSYFRCIDSDVLNFYKRIITIFSNLKYKKIIFIYIQLYRKSNNSNTKPNLITEYIWTVAVVNHRFFQLKSPFAHLQNRFSPKTLTAV